MLEKTKQKYNRLNKMEFNSFIGLEAYIYKLQSCKMKIEPLKLEGNYYNHNKREK